MKMHDPEFDDLLAAASDGRASDEEIDRLQQLLMADLDATDEYLNYVDTHANLVDDSVEVDSERIEPFPKPRSLSVWPVLLGIAALVLIALFSAFLLRNEVQSPREESPNYIAIVTHAEGALWEGEDASVIIGSALTPGVIELCEGRVELELNSGVHVALEGRTRFRLVDAKHGVLEEGRLSANVPPSGMGFTVNTPEMEVVDLGTEFGLNVSDSGSEVHVFDGEVEATVSQHTELLTTNHTRRAQSKNGELERVEFDPKRFVEPPTKLDGVARIFGDIRVLRTPPKTVRTGAYQHNFVLIFQEQAHIELEDPLEVSVSRPGRYQVGFAPENHGDFEKMLKVGETVDSYLLHYDTSSSSMTRSNATVQFDRPIVAVIAGGRQMAATDELLGTWCTTYDRPGDSARQLENDTVIISSDRRRLTLDWGVDQEADQIRVLVQSR
ncbi:MAG: hypothetical protein ACI8UO_002271 [Verrucomicrobiales bacterium]|jgi:hypothetical protein